MVFAACAASFGGTLLLLLFMAGPDNAARVWNGWAQFILGLLGLPLVARFLKRARPDD